MDWKKILKPNLFRVILLIVSFLFVFYAEIFFEESKCVPCCESHLGLPFTFIDNYEDSTTHFSNNSVAPCEFLTKNKTSQFRATYSYYGDKTISVTQIRFQWLLVDLIIWYIGVTAVDLLFRRKKFIKSKIQK